ncbi:hypothetical protein Ahy_A05g024737 [Arachis hypogaea]|uniref:Aminotransferase-like plant mobile domain-containing protein n=1 Tax=Arachis hypogaea TaxID=3818 RepID=A0A445D6J3_ARAHY|nr:hypothetical protein Ahy_A05g024737 [Arachis hypogaea]
MINGKGGLYNSEPQYCGFVGTKTLRGLLDEVQEGQFVWKAYGVDRIEADVIPEDIHSQSEIWSATVPLISFETLECHAIDRCRRQFEFVQGVPHQERSLDGQHGEI